MANWKYSINIKHAWKQYDDGEITIPNLSKYISFKLKELPYVKNGNLIFLDIVESFDEIALLNENDEETEELEDSFNNAMKRLYNFGDEDHRLWIGTV